VPFIDARTEKKRKEAGGKREAWKIKKKYFFNEKRVKFIVSIQKKDENRLFKKKNGESKKKKS
jgi:hypothetical protein